MTSSSDSAVRILHCADLHLGARLRDSVRESVSDDLSPQERVLLRDAHLLSLDLICTTAIENQVDCVIIAGDIFDGRDQATKDQRVRSRFTAFLSLLNEHNIDVAIALGNHDPIKSITKLNKAWPDNVHLFSSKKPETVLIEKDGRTIALHGVSYATNDESRDLSVLFPQAVSNAVNIGVLHTNVGGNSQHTNYAPSTSESLCAHHYDYFALGHIHKRSIISESPLVAYSGNSQGLSAKPSEQEPKGCVLISVDAPGGAVSSTFIPTDCVRYISLSINAHEFLEEDDIVSFASQTISSACGDDDIFYLVRANLDVFGEVDPASFLGALNDIRTNYFVTSIKTENSFRSFEELVDQDPFYGSIQSELTDATPPNIEELYGPRAATMARYVNDEDIDIRDDAASVILATLSDLKHSGQRS